MNLATTLELTVPDHVETIALCGGPYSNFAPVASSSIHPDSHARDTAAAQAD
jgi:hypothetical protein